VDWIPVDVAAATITDLLTSGNGERGNYEVHNIVNPHPIPWSSLVDMLQESGSKWGEEKEEMEIVPMKTWVQRLSALADSGVSPDEVPGLRLLQFFEGMVGDEGEEGGRVFETGKTRGLSGSLRGCEAFNGGWLEGNVGVWRESGFLK
jgi:hypothetical protein